MRAPGGSAMRLANGRLPRSLFGLVLCVWLWGCAHTPPRLPQSPSDELGAQLGTIGVPISVVTATPAITAPTSGKSAGALKGAALGFAAGASPGLYVTGGVAQGCGGGGRQVATACALVM